MGYDDQLDRVLSASPGVAEGDDRSSVPGPTARQEGNVTVYGNFATTHDRLARETTHVLKFFQTELGTNAQIDDRGRARFISEFRQRRIADALDEHVESFVLCSECGSPDTKLTSQRGADVLKCDAYGALSVIPDL